MKTDERASLDNDIKNKRIPSKGSAEFRSYVQKGDLDTIRYLVDERKVVHLSEFVNETRKQRFNVILLAVENNHLEVLKYFLEEKNGDVNLLNSKRTPLSVAADRGFLEVVKYLVGRGANPDPKVREEYHPLVVAAKNGQLDVLKYLHEEKNVDVNTSDYWGDTPLEAAAKAKHHETVKYLIEHKAYIDDAILSATRNGRLRFAAYLQNMLNKRNRRSARLPNVKPPMMKHKLSQPIVVSSQSPNSSRSPLRKELMWVSRAKTSAFHSWSDISQFVSFLFSANYFVGLNNEKSERRRPFQSLETNNVESLETESFIMNAIKALPSIFTNVFPLEYEEKKIL